MNEKIQNCSLCCKTEAKTTVFLQNQTEVIFLLTTHPYSFGKLIVVILSY